MHLFIICVIFLLLKYVCSKPPLPSPTPFHLANPNVSHRNHFYFDGNHHSFKNIKVEIADNAILIVILSLNLVTVLWQFWLYNCNQVTYVHFASNLNLFKKKSYITKSPQCCWHVTLTMVGLLLSDCKKGEIVLLISMNVNFGNVLDLTLKFKKTICRILFVISSIVMFSIAVTPAACILCLLVLQIMFHSCAENMPHWLPIILILLSNDIHLNPGPNCKNNYFNFMSWNLNSLAKDKFQRVSLIEAHNSIINYDLISICETSLNDSVELPKTLLNEYTFVPANNPANTRHGGVGLFYKNTLPIIVRKDLSFDESIVVELKFGRKKNISYCFVSKSCL